MGLNIRKNQKNEKPKHIFFLCHIVSIKVDKQGLDIFKPEYYTALVQKVSYGFIKGSKAKLTHCHD